MTTYRVHVFNEHGRLVTGRDMSKSSDAEALEAARASLANAPRVELWRGELLIATLGDYNTDDGDPVAEVYERIVVPVIQPARWSS